MLVFFQEASECIRSRLSRKHGLTQTEIDVALALVAGLSPLEISEQRGTGLATVRSHLKHIYLKLGVRRQTELVLFVSRLVSNVVQAAEARSA